MLWRRHSVHGMSSCVIGTLPLCNRTRTLQPNHAQERNPPPAEAPAVPAKPPPEPKQPLPRPSIVEAWPPFGWPPFMVLLQLGSCASSGRAWLLRAAQVGSARTATAPTTARHQTPPAPPPKPPQPYALSPDRPMQARERELSPGRLDHARARAARHAVPAVPRGAPQVHRGRGGRTLT